MRQSFAAFSDNDQAGVGTPIGAQHADLSAIHEYGDPSRNIPARPMLPTKEQGLTFAQEIYSLFVMQSIQDADL
jgi:phage gpG-like protein